MNTSEESFPETLAINGVSSEILSEYEKLGKTSQEIRNIVKDEFHKLGGVQAMGSQLLWANYGHKDLKRNVLKILGIDAKKI
jgi:predicted transcriptional regulator